MKPATVSEIKKELNTQEPSKLVELCLRLAKYKKDNKELLTYLLFEENNEAAFINTIKYEVDEFMITINTRNIYYLKKNLRKILRHIDKHIRYSGNKETEAELRIYFCKKIKAVQIPVKRSKVLTNLYEGQIKKIKNAIVKLHEDLQYDYGVQLKEIEI